MRTLYLTEQQWNNRMKTIETKNLKKYRKSSTWVSLMHYFQDCVLCIHDGTIREIDEDKYKEIRQHVMSKEFCLKIKG